MHHLKKGNPSALTRNGPREHAKHPIRVGHGHGLRPEHLLRRQHRVEGHVGEHVHHGDEGAGNGDGTRKILDRILQLLDDKVQVVPV